MQKKDLHIYYTLIVVTIIFTICDLVVSYSQMLTMSLIFSSLTMAVSFVGRHKATALQMESQVDDTIKFIKSNFNCKNLILSVLDVLCCLIAFFTGVFLIAAISRSVLAIRLIVIINKYKTVAFGFWSFIFMYLFRRGAKRMENKENKFVKTVKNAFKWIWYNKKSIIGSIFAVGSGVATAIVTNSDKIAELPKLEFLGLNFTALIFGVFVFAGIEVGVVGKGFETIAQAIERIGVQNQLKEQNKAEKVAKKEIKAEMKAKAKAANESQIAEEENSKKQIAEKERKEKEEAKAREEAEFRAKVEAKKAELLKKNENK